MPLDLQPVESSLDLRPVAAELDLQPFEPDRHDSHNAVMRPAEPESTAHKVWRAIRERLTPILGPDQEQFFREAIPVHDDHGQVGLQFKPEGSAIDQEGLMGGLSHPFIQIPKADANHPAFRAFLTGALERPPTDKEAAVGAALLNTVSGFGEFFESPLGLATGGVGSVGGQVARRAVSGGFAADMARHVPEQATRAGELSVTGTPQEQAEADLALGASTVMPGFLANHAAARERMATPQEQLQVQRTTDRVPTISEFGGEEPEAQPAAVVEPATTVAENATVQPAPVPAAAVVKDSFTTDLAAGDVRRVPAEAIATRPDLMQFKRMDETATGINAEDKLGGKWDDLKAGNLLLWEPADPAAHGLEDGEKYIVANGHHRFEFGERQDVPAYNAQVVREADGISAQDARSLAAEINIADGKGTIYDQVKFLRNESATHGADEAVARAGRTGIKGRQAAAIAFQAGPDLYDSFVNERVKPDQAEAIAAAAPAAGGEVNLSLQRQGILDAAEGASPQAISNLIQAYRLEMSQLPPAEQFDLFGGNDTALNAAKQLAKMASRIQGELAREIRATDAAARNATTAKAKGITFAKSPEEILAQNAQLRAELERWQHYGTEPELIAQLRGYAEMERSAKGPEAGRGGQTPDAIERTLDKLIEVTRPDQSQLLEGVTGAPVWITKAAAHGVLQVARAAYVATRSLAKAIAAGVDHLRGLNLAGFHEGEAQAWLEQNLNLRQRADRIEQGNSSPEVKTATAADALYTPRTFEQLQTEARAIIQARGLDNAFETFRNPDSALPMDTRSALGAELEAQFKLQEKIALGKGDKIAADEMVQRQVDLWRADAYGTELAQALNARKLYDDASPRAKLKQAQDLFDEAGGRRWAEAQPDADKVRTVIDQSRAEATESVRQDPAVNEAARAAVNEAVAGSSETHKAIVMELAEPWASAPSVLAHAREQVRSKANELLNRSPRPPGFTPAQHLRQILDDLAQRAADIAAGHYQGSEPGVVLKDKLIRRLGLGEAQASRLAKQLDAEFARQMEAAKAKLPKRIATARAARDARLVPETEAQVDAALRRQLRELNLRLGQLLQEESARKQSAGKTLAERIVQASGLTGDAAAVLQATLERRFAALLQEAARRRLEAMERTGGKINPRVKGLIGELTRMAQLGAFDDGRFYDLVKRKLEIPVMSDELAREIVRRANRLEKIPAGELRDRESQRLLNFVVSQRGIGRLDLGMSIYVSNLLAGIKTPAKILFENGTLLTAQTLNTLRHPAMMLHPWEFVAKPFLRGQVRGLMQSAEIMRTGVVTGIRADGAKPANVLERRPLGKYDWLNVWKWPMRAVAAAHVPLFKPAWELKQTAIAIEVARSEHLRGQALVQRVADLMGQTDAHVAAARTQAHGELAGLGYFQPRGAGEGMARYAARAAGEKLDLQRRIGEIVTQARETTMPGSTELARGHALHFTYLNKPYGLLGYVANLFTTRGELKPSVQNQVYAAAVKTQIPFVSVAANIVNEHLNWTPIGAGRAALSHWTNELYGEQIRDPEARADLYARSIAGTILMAGVYTLWSKGLIGLSGPGPKAPAANKQWREAGNEPYSLTIGDRRFSFVNVPWASSLAVLGAWNDYLKFDKGEEADADTRAAFALKSSMTQALNIPMLTGLKDFLDAVSQQGSSGGGNKLEKLLARTASTAVVPKWARDVDQAFDPGVRDQTGIAALMASQVPFVRRGNMPVLNVLGEPVVRGVWDAWTGKLSQDPVWRTMVEKNAFVPEAPKSVMVGDRKRGPDFYRALTPEERYDYVRDSGQAIRERLENSLDRIQDLEPDEARKMINKITEEERQKLRSRLR